AYFFIARRRRHTRSNRDWSSDVCSSDLSLPWSFGGDHVQMPSLLIGEQRTHSPIQLRTGRLRERRHGLLAEDRIEQLARCRRSRIGRLRLLGEHHHRKCRRDTVDPQGEETAAEALLGRLGADQRPCPFLPLAYRPRRTVAELRRSTIQRNARVVEQRLTGRRLRPRAIDALGGAFGVLDQHGRQALFDRLAHIARCAALATKRVDHPLADTSDLLLQRSHELASADERLPTGSYLTGQQRA